MTISTLLFLKQSRAKNPSRSNYVIKRKIIVIYLAIEILFKLFHNSHFKMDLIKKVTKLQGVPKKSVIND